jgi:hypothetical protein
MDGKALGNVKVIVGAAENGADPLAIVNWQV